MNVQSFHLFKNTYWHKRFELLDFGHYDFLRPSCPSDSLVAVNNMRTRRRIWLQKRTHIDIGRRAKRVIMVRMIIVEEYGGSEGGIGSARARSMKPSHRPWIKCRRFVRFELRATFRARRVPWKASMAWPGHDSRSETKRQPCDHVDFTLSRIYAWFERNLCTVILMATTIFKSNQ